MELKVSDLRISHEYGRGYNLSVHIEDVGVVESLDAFRQEMNGGAIRMNMKKWSDRRSLSANAYAWVLIDKIATAMHITVTEVYRHAIREVGGNKTIVCVQNNALDALRKGWEANGIGWVTDTADSKLPGCTNVILYMGSSEYDVHQMHRLIETLIHEAKELGIETLTPADLERMLNSWNIATSAVSRA